MPSGLAPWSWRSSSTRSSRLTSGGPLFAEVTRDREAFAWAAAPTGGRAVHAGFKGTAALAGPLLRMRFGINAETAARGWEKTDAAMDRLESELDGRDYLVGDGFTVADLTAAALFFPLVRPAEARVPDAGAAARGARAARAKRSRRAPGFKWVQEMYRRHRGESAEVPA